jgi:hypothetical protein
MSAIVTADTDAEIAACFEVMQQLRPHLASAAAFMARVRVQQAQGYRLAALTDDRVVRAVAGYRHLESLFGPRVVRRRSGDRRDRAVPRPRCRVARVA